MTEKIHIIVQHYPACSAERQQELHHSLTKLLESRWVERVHNLIEPGTPFPESVLRHPKHQIVDHPTRLTYRAAFDYANEHLPGRVVAVCNSDIYLDDDCPWQNVIDLDHRIVLCLSRHEENEDGTLHQSPEIADSLGSMSQDGWFFKAPIDVQNCDFPLGVLGCDNAIAHRLKGSGYTPVNQGSVYRIIHVDRCRGKNGENFVQFHNALPANSTTTRPSRYGQLLVPDANLTGPLGNYLAAFQLDALEMYTIKCEVYSTAFSQKEHRNTRSQDSGLLPASRSANANTTEARHYVTYCDQNYLVRAIALALSIREHESRPWKLYLICCDQATEHLVTELGIDGIVPIPLSIVEKSFPALDGCRDNRDAREYYWTLTPIVIRHILNTVPEAEICTYLDADTLFFSDPQPIFDELGDQSILIHEHRFSASMYDNHDPHVFGRFNVGLMCFRRDVNGLKALSWWQERCIEWCYFRVEDHKFGDQKYLDQFPNLFEGVQLLETVAAGAGPWNHANYRFDRHPEGQPTIDGEPLIHYHFHGLTICSPEVFIGFRYFYPIERNTLRAVYLPYIECLRHAGELLNEVQPGFCEGMNSPLVASAHNNTLLIHQSSHDHLALFDRELRILPLVRDWSQATTKTAINISPCA